MSQNQDTSPLPVERQPDGGMNNHGSTFQFRCENCRNIHLCLSLRCTTERSTVCAFGLSRFQKRKAFRK